MDYFDPHKRMRNTVTLYVGYVLVGIAISIATVILLYQAYGFGINRKGVVIQNGLLFVSSQPRPEDIYIDGKQESVKTNTRLTLPAAIYKLTLARAGYQDWTRTITVDGGQVLHFDYPMLIPKKLITTKLLSYPEAPGIITQSSDKRWLLLSQAAKFGSFDVFDLKNPTKAPTVITLPPNILDLSANPSNWQVVEWADDNQHLLLKHVYGDKFEYILVDRQTPDQSVNLTTALANNPTQLNLIDRKYDRYYLYDAATRVLNRATLKDPTLVPVLRNVINYKSYGSDTLIYATEALAPAGKVRIVVQAGTQSYTIRSAPAGTNYLLDITKYKDTFYVVAGAASENKVYIYNDPVLQMNNNGLKAPAPTQVLHVNMPNYVSFSSTAQYIVAENGAQFGVYDIENKRGYNYIAHQPLDAPQPHASWMDGNRLTYVSNGQQVIFDYDYQNLRTLGPSSPAYIPAFAPDFKYSYTINGEAQNVAALDQTALLIPSDL